MRKRKPGAGRPLEMHPPWDELAKAVGGAAQLAEKFGVGTSTINKWARGVHRIPTLALKEVERLCKYYNIEFNEKDLTDSFSHKN